MAASYLHGAETIELRGGVRPINPVKTAVIGLVGTAPTHLLDDANATLNQLQQVLSDVDAGKFGGPQVPGFTIPQALNAIYDQGSGTVLMVNVFDETTHKSSVSDEAVTLDDEGQATLANSTHGIISATVKSSDGSTTHVEGTDYTLDKRTGTITRLDSGAITAGAELTVDYDHPDLSVIEGSDIIGTVDSSGNRTGLQAFLNSFNRFGFWPKILIAPEYSTQESVAAELEVIAGESNCRGVALIDAPIGTTRDDAIAGRGPDGSINFNFSSDRVGLCFPHVEAYDAATDSTRLEPYSQRLAGVIAATDHEYGYWYSPSNKTIQGITGVELDLSAMINNPTSDVNALNEAGIITVFNSFGSGLRTWGNRSSAYPRSTGPTNFLQTRRTADMVHESLEYAMLQFIDLPINQALIDAITESANGFIRTLIGRGALLPGSKCEWLKANNPDTEIANGHLTFNITMLPPPPAERITFESFLDVNLLSNLQTA